MTDDQRRALLYVVIAVLAGVVLCVAFAAMTHAQCMCPAPGEPPVTWAGLPPVQPGGGYVFLAWVTR